MMKRCRWIVVSLTFVLFLFLTGGPSALAVSVGVLKDTDRIYVPVRYLSEQFGYEATWNPHDQRITLSNQQNTVILQVNSRTVHLNGEAVTTDASPFIKSGITFIPLRLVSDAMGIAVTWDDQRFQVELMKDGTKVVLPVMTEQRWNETVERSPIQNKAHTILVQKKKISANVVTVDLLHPKVSLKVAVAEGKVGNVSELKEIAADNGAAVAINGTFFDAYTESSIKSPYGYIVAEGEIVNSASWDKRTVFSFDRQNTPGMFSGEQFLEILISSEEEVYGALQVGPRLLMDGEVSVDPESEGFRDPKILTMSGARSALGITKDYKLLIVTTNGATIPELAEVMRQTGAYQAMNMDGGASSGLWLNEKYITKPGRAISNALLVVLN
ncbi:phosphodiester glycosidase family protein [Paenibacillus antri]|nr:phosphodiester glycosidase family protein [Paenibacillus antri]